MEFNCVQDCSQCCIEREYYPSKRFGKVGVLILPDEKERIERLADGMGIGITILPRIGISRTGEDQPSKVIAYQLMGREPNGNTCPFLDTESEERSGHGGYLCRIYDRRPLACSAYPLMVADPVTLDQKCKFCQECGHADGNLDREMESLARIRSKMSIVNADRVWRYATGVGEESERDEIGTGWVPEA